MLKRTLFFGSPGKLHISNGLLVYETSDEQKNFLKRTFPLEDIGFIVVESTQIMLTSFCINSLAENNTAVIFCDAAHMPSAQVIPFAANSLMQKSCNAQMNASDALKNRLWKQIVQAKIRNQAECLRRLGLNFQKIRFMEQSVRVGDIENAEAVAARFYFRQFGSDEDFLRDRTGIPPNHALNYGYAILRAATARALIGSGLLCIAGIHHSNQYNAFALADDIMEPYRPFVDDLIFSEREFFSADTLSKEHKAELLRLLTCDVSINGCRRPLMNALSYTTASLAECYLKEKKNIAFPEFV